MIDMTNTNSSIKVWQALLIAAVMTLFGVIATIGTTGVRIQSQVAVNEANIETHDARFGQLDERLRSIEGKLDRLIERP